MTEYLYNSSYRRKCADSDVENEVAKSTMSKSTSKSPSKPNSDFQNGHGKLAQEIQDELLICKICLENYKQPKSLSCLHTFCSQCLENHVEGEVTYKKYSDYRDVTCPLCRKRTSVPVGGIRKLPDNFVVASLFEMIQKRNSSISNADNGYKEGLTCQICQQIGNRKKEAQTKCIDCSKLMCRSCTEMHKKMKVTKHHSLFDLNIEEDVICKVHNEESVRFFCEPCETCICVLCTFNDHQDHEVTQFREAVVKYKSQIEKEQIKCKNIILKFEEKLNKITKAEDIIRATKVQIHDLSLKLTYEIQNKEKNLLEEIRNIYGDDMLKIIQSKPVIEAQLSELKNSCNMADVVMLRKDVELLLLKKDIQRKLSEMNHIQDIELPQTILKEVRFIPGILDFGSIQDMDRPLLTRPRSYKEFLENKSIPKPEKISIETQTDPSISQPTIYSKSVSTIPVQTSNKAVNTRSRIVQSNQKTKSLQTLNGSLNSLEAQPVTSIDRKILMINSNQISLSPNILRKSYDSEKNRNSNTKELILTASEILNEYIINENLNTKICVEIDDHIPISDS